MTTTAVPRSGPVPMRFRASPLALAALGLTYLALDVLMWETSDQTASMAPIWPAAGLALVATAVARGRDRAFVLATIFVAALTANLLYDVQPGTALVWAAAMTLEPLLGALGLAWLYRRRGPGGESPRRTVWFVVTVAIAGPPLAALIGALSAHVAYDDDLLPSLRVWYLSDLLGILLVAPVLFRWPRVRGTLREPRFAGLMLLTAAVASVIFSGISDATVVQPYLLGPVLVLAAFLFGTPGAALAGLIGVAIAALCSSLGVGPYAITGASALDRTLELQLFALVQLFTVQALAGLRTHLMELQAHAERLGAQQLIDPLTGVGNRRCLDEALDEVTATSRGNPAGPVAVLFADLDGFKPINDAHGHGVGDEVLQVVAERLLRIVRAGDRVARPGGDEFVIVCPGLEQASAHDLAERMTARIEEPMAVAGITLRVAASVGVAWIAEPAERAGDLLRAADEAMYRVKAERRIAARARRAAGEA